MSEVEVKYNPDLALYQCEKCQYFFTVHEAPGAAGVTPDGRFIGRCPKCDHRHGSDS